METTTNRLDISATVCALKAVAASQVAQYPQYNDHFVNYQLARVKRNVRTKLGLAFIQGEYVIAIKRDAMIHNGVIELPAEITAWSRRNACDTYLKSSDVEWVVS